MLAVIMLASVNAADAQKRDEIIPLEGKIIVSLQEKYAEAESVDVPQLLISFTTIEWYNCANYSLLCSTYVSKESVSISIKGVRKPDICFTTAAQVKWRFPLRLDRKFYQLDLNNMQAKDSYRISIDDSLIRVSGDTGTWTDVNQRMIWRLKPRTLAYLCGTTEETQWICDSFINSLAKVVSLIEFFYPASGKKPFPESAFGYWVNKPARYFIYNTESDYDKMGKFLEEFSHNVIGKHTGVGVRLLNWRGKEYNSWYMR